MWNSRKLVATLVVAAACSDATAPPEAAVTAPSPQFARRPGSTGDIVRVVLDLRMAFEIDQQGRIAGTASATVKGVTRPAGAALWTPTVPRGTSGTTTVLESIAAGETPAEAHDVATNGPVVGWGMEDSRQQPLLWDMGVHRLGLPAGMSGAFTNRISEPRSDGTRLVTGGSSGAVVWRIRGAGSTFEVLSRDVLPGASIEATAANASGLVVGNGPFKWQTVGGQWVATQLQLPPGSSSGTALDVNAAGTIVGVSYADEAGKCNQSVMWPAGSTAPTKLPDLAGGTCGTAWGINDAGHIVGDARDPKGSFTAVMWRPLVGGGYAVAGLGCCTTRDLTEPYAEGGATYVNIAGGTATNGVLWKVKLP